MEESEGTGEGYDEAEVSFILLFIFDIDPLNQITEMLFSLACKIDGLFESLTCIIEILGHEEEEETS